MQTQPSPSARHLETPEACILSGIDASKCALFLDVDGTLIDIAPLPSAVQIPPTLVELLSRTQQAFGGAMAIVTGRRIEEADALLKPLKFAASGVHGCEVRFSPDGLILQQESDRLPVLDRLFELVSRMPGLVVEPKGSGAAIHYRSIPNRRDDVERCLRAIIGAAPSPLQLVAGRRVFEVLPIGRSKGTALEALLKSPPFAGRIPVMIGDDVGDAPAFELALGAGGCALKVAGEHFPLQAADFDGPAGVRDWLQRIAGSA